MRLAWTLAFLAMLTTLANPSPAAAATLTTHARVVFVSPAEATLDGIDSGADATWSITGEPQEQVQVTFEWRTLDGATHQRLADASLRLDADGRTVATMTDVLDQVVPAPASGSPLVITMVICRQ